MNRCIFITLLLVLCLPVTGIAADDITYVNKITVFETSVHIEQHEEYKIEYKITPSDATDTGVSFESSNESVATVDDEGTVYGKKKGNTKIKIKSNDKKATATVTVYVTADEDDDYNEVRTVAIMQGGEIVNKPLKMMATEKMTLGVKIYPASANKNVKWRSDDEEVATVDSKGVVTAISEGTCKIYVSSKSNSSKKDYINLTVTKFIKYPDSIKISPAEGSIYETGNTVRFTAKLSPDNTTERIVRWQVYGSGATIDANGVLAIKDKGKITVKAYTADRKLSDEYVIESKYGANHFERIGTAENILSDRKIRLQIDKNINIFSAKNAIKAYKDDSCNGDEIPVTLEVIGNTVTVIPNYGWNIGENYIIIKDSLKDTNGEAFGKNYKYKLNVRGDG